MSWEPVRNIVANESEIFRGEKIGTEVWGRCFVFWVGGMLSGFPGGQRQGLPENLPTRFPTLLLEKKI